MPPVVGLSVEIGGKHVYHLARLVAVAERLRLQGLDEGLGRVGRAVVGEDQLVRAEPPEGVAGADRPGEGGREVVGHIAVGCRCSCVDHVVRGLLVCVVRVE